ncbi:hypothetical protein AMTR_s00108p00104560 [Amborella trichopoda]|uniref:Uncharacterized protein n=1 Tax=Amborella trichopoda TaxID=13333 RepID=W1NUR3_AMBTC|nr:hypothetical protein AMTR_s00108p00104560 [Amborella trichopoda]
MLSPPHASGSSQPMILPTSTFSVALIPEPSPFSLAMVAFDAGTPRLSPPPPLFSNLQQPLLQPPLATNTALYWFVNSSSPLLYARPSSGLSSHASGVSASQNTYPWSIV